MIYSPSQIAAFSVGNEFYESATVEIEVSPEKANEYSFESDFKIENQTAFLQCLVKGEKVFTIYSVKQVKTISILRMATSMSYSCAKSMDEQKTTFYKSMKIRNTQAS